MTEPSDTKPTGVHEEIVKSLQIQGGMRGQQRRRLLDADNHYAIEASVVSARNCKVGHAVGDRLLFDVHGNLDPAHCPDKICIYLISQLVAVIARINEKLMQTGDSDDLYFLRYARCPDVGVQNLGYGEVVVRTRIIPRFS